MRLDTYNIPIGGGLYIDLGQEPTDRRLSIEASSAGTESQGLEFGEAADYEGPPPLQGDQAALLPARQHAADGLPPKPQVTSKLGPQEGQRKHPPSLARLAQVPRKLGKQGGKASFARKDPEAVLELQTPRQATAGGLEKPRRELGIVPQHLA